MKFATEPPESPRPLRVLGVSGSNTPISKTAVLVSAALRAAGDADPLVTTDLYALAERRLDFCDGRDPALYEGETRRAIDAVTAADALIVGSPMYRGSYPGVLKNLFDLLPNDALAGKAVALIASGGTDHHYLALEHELRPLLSFFRAHTLPGAVYARNDDFAGGELVSEPVAEQLRRLGAGLVALARALPGAAVGADGPVIPRRALVDG